MLRRKKRAKYVVTEMRKDDALPGTLFVGKSSEWMGLVGWCIRRKHRSSVVKVSASSIGRRALCKSSGTGAGEGAWRFFVDCFMRFSV